MKIKYYLNGESIKNKNKKFYLIYHLTNENNEK